MEKQYYYNGNHYTLKPLSLGIMKDIIPVIIRLRKLIYQYTNDIDMTEVNKLKFLIAGLEKAREQLTAQLEGELSNEERLHTANRINSLNEKILLYKSELESDRNISEKNKLYNECSAMAVFELFSDISLLQPVICKILSPENVEIDPRDPLAVKFLSNVLTDFFLLITMNNGV